MNYESTVLTQLQKHAGYQYLENTWLERISEIEEKRDKAAQRGSETAWRYWAGLEKGYKEAAMALKVMLVMMEQEMDTQTADDKFAAIARDLQGEPK